MDLDQFYQLIFGFNRIISTVSWSLDFFEISSILFYRVYLTFWSPFFQVKKDESCLYFEEC